MKKLLFIVVSAIFVLGGCSEEKKTIDLRDLCKSWVFEGSVNNKDFNLSEQNKLKLIRYKSADHQSAIGWQFEDTGKLISFRIVDGKKQDLGFIHGLWAVNEDCKMLVNMDGTKPVFKILVLTKNNLIIEKDGVLAD